MTDNITDVRYSYHRDLTLEELKDMVLLPREKKVIDLIDHTDTQVRVNQYGKSYIRVQGYLDLEDFKKVCDYIKGTSIDSVTWRGDSLYIMTWIVQCKD